MDADEKLTAVLYWLVLPVGIGVLVWIVVFRW